jgi:hypothetical protein
MDLGRKVRFYGVDGTGPSSGFIQPTRFHKMREISSLAGKPLASHEELSCLE